jgi:hypothetical protein
VSSPTSVGGIGGVSGGASIGLRHLVGGILGAAFAECALKLGVNACLPHVDVGGNEEYGPFFKLVSSARVAQIVASGVIEGTFNRNVGGRSPFATVDAYVGDLPPGQTGVEFYTSLAPRVVRPNYWVQWGLAEGAQEVPGTGGDWVFIPVTVVKANGGQDMA